MLECLPLQPGSQKEMQIDFDDDETPQQTEQGNLVAQNAAKQPRVQVYLTLVVPLLSKVGLCESHYDRSCGCPTVFCKH